jgi:heat-inducible transcriptional repressor
MGGELTTRRKQVLDALVNEYILHALPVSSKTICERYELSVSSATVRSELAGLEENGYVVSPHTSAGRIPTDNGYRSFVDTILLDKDIEDDRTREQLQVAADELDELISRTCDALARLTHCLAVLTLPRYRKVEISRVTFTALSSRRLLIVAISADGQVFDSQLELGMEIDDEVVHHLEESMNRVIARGFSNENASQVVRHLQFDDIGLAERIILELVKMLETTDDDRLYHQGFSTLLSLPDFASSEQSAPLARLIEDGATMRELLARCITDSGRITVRIGHENPSSAMTKASLVASEYEVDGLHGVVAVIGPTRMDYARAIQAVDAASRIIGESL